MEASTPILSKKRKQPPQPPLPSNANPYTGILTRKKSQKYFFHQNRSGASRKSRSFPSDFLNPNQCSTQKFAKLSDLINNGNKVDVDDDEDDEIYHISIKDLRARRVLPKPPKGDALVGKKENPKVDCDKSDVEIGGLLGKCVDFEEGLKEGNTNMIVSEMCDDSRFNREEKCLIRGNPSVIVSEMCDDSRVNIGKEGLIGLKSNLIVPKTCDDLKVNIEKESLIRGNPSVIVLEMCDDSRVNIGKEGLTGLKSNLIVPKTCDDLRVNIENESLIKGNPNLIFSESCDDSRVNYEKGGLIWGNPSLIDSEICDDSRVNYEKEGLIGGNPSLIVSEICDDYRVNYEKEGLMGGNPSLIVSEICDDSRVNSEKEGLIGVNPSLIVLETSDDSRVKEYLIGENPKLISSERCDASRVSCEKKGSIGGNPNMSICDSKVNREVEDSIGRSRNISICDTRVVGKGESLDVATCDCEDHVSNGLSPNLSRSGEQSEENVQTTPPDAVILARPRIDQSVLQNKSVETRSPPKQISPSKGGSVEGKKSFSNPRKNLGLHPCSRLKLFKTPNSFSYRRLLPFLMDLAKDETCAPKSNAVIKNETDSEAISTVPSSQESITGMAKMEEKQPEPVAPCKPLEMKTGIGEHMFSLRTKTSDSSAKEGTPCTPIRCPTNNLENPISDEISLGTPVSNDPKIKGESVDGRVVSLDTAGKGKAEDISSVVVTEPTVTPANTNISAEPSGADRNLNITPHLSLSIEREHREAQVEGKPEENSLSVISSSPKLKALVSSDPTRIGLARGILKRNPRGCRGICDCLNCTSFRLNAEKAFEFSRNQWFEAEELATDLMNELSSLRSVLEKSFNSANNNAIISVDQVQDICKRASGAEDIARSRLSQMNEDLHVHCRIKPLQRPRVTFSSNVQEKIIGATDSAR